MFNSRKDFSPIFICGIAGSGTSLLAKSLFQKYKCALIDESALSMPHNSPLKMYRSSGYINIEHYYYNILLSLWLPDNIIKKWYQRFYMERIPPFSSYTKTIDKSPFSHMVRAPVLKRIFPESYFILVFRDPSANIEGLIRKWPLFRNSELADVVCFWKKLHIDFINNHLSFNDGIFGISYESLIENYDLVLDRIAFNCGLVLRKNPAKLPDVGNQPKTNIRNIKDGKIICVKNSNQESIDRLEQESKDFINTELMNLYGIMIDRYEKPLLDREIN